MVEDRTKRRRFHEPHGTSNYKIDMELHLSLNDESTSPRPHKQPMQSLMAVRESATDMRSKLLSDRENEAQDLLKSQFDLMEADDTYHQKRAALLLDEKTHRWDEPARHRASQAEQKAQNIITKIREHERIDPTIYGNLPGEAVPDAQTRDMGGRFLVNKPSIERSKVFEIAKMMPKGSHLHLHFNSELPPEVLFPHARSAEMAKTMFIRSTRPLCAKSDFANSEIVFNVLPDDTQTSDIFDPNYNSDLQSQTSSPWMLWADFRQKFPTDLAHEVVVEDMDEAESWAREKMTLTVHGTYDKHQTHNGTWACFNQGTRAFKGLLNYEGIYRWYIGNAIESMISDKVMYAELRPMLLDKTIPSNDGRRKLDHREQMTIICEEIEKKRTELDAAGNLDKFPFGLKIIYCTPRSIPRKRMQTELQDCIKLKLQFPHLICGFDLVGAEDRPNNVGFYADLLLAFTKTCEGLNISIPFMFHAGETLLDTGGSSNPDNSNLYDSLLLNAKRIGHGYALLKHPLLVEKYKAQNICLELCPISNELLHLCGNARQHPYPQLLAAGLHCTLNADNPSLFSSSLSHEFHQVMVGDPRMTIHGWKQLAEWSLEHSCLTAEEIGRALEIHRRDWEGFCEWVVETYGLFADGLAELE
ncbi:Hypothetical protein R9X50_00528500 [Acrodontium crateriforme]|uniref:adenosine deaminase n=1 Tax=Acrodontium crateriforme TaxID=150365 RepID=A0AAQ3R5S9_9PEZI|nr:Hypothetical protein R9X50_00528500 [Acrodontium crateriforme]